MTAGVLRPPKRPSAAPVFWVALCTARLETTPMLAQELWNAYQAVFPYSAQTVRFELDRALTAAPHAILAQRVQRLCQLVTPQDLLRATRHLSPEGGTGRRRGDVVACEETLLRHCVDQTGAWR